MKNKQKEWHHATKPLKKIVSHDDILHCFQSYLSTLKG
jgi:hypothetical protein